MIQSDRTICATADRAEVEAHRYGREENRPLAWLGVNATWRERRLFDWSYLAAQARRSGNKMLEIYALHRRMAFAITSEVTS